MGRRPRTSLRSEGVGASARPCPGSGSWKTMEKDPRRSFTRRSLAHSGKASGLERLGQRRSGGGTAHLLLGALRRWLLRRGRGRALHRGGVLALRDELVLPALEDLARQERGGVRLAVGAPVGDELTGVHVGVA